MRGQCAPSAPGRRFQRNDTRDEIQRAIDEVRFSEERAHAGSGYMHISPVAPEPPHVAPKLVFVKPVDRVHSNIVVHVRGRVPLAFFPWFKELRSQLEDQQTMLSRCHFEEAD